MYKNILVSTDGSKLSEKAAKHAVDLAKALGSHLTAVTVTQKYPVTYIEGSMPVNNEQAAEIEARWRAESQKYVDAIKELGKSLGVDVETQVISGDIISDAILDYANSKQIDLIVMASHGRKGISRLLLGSETQHVLTDSKIPVLVLH